MTTITENDDTTPEEELIPVETPPVEKTEAEEGDEEEDEGDERLAESEEDNEDDIASGTTNRDRRKKRREMQRRAREAKERELDALRQQTQMLQQRLAAVEGFATNSAVQGLEGRIAQKQAEIRQAEAIMARAAEAGNGEDMVAALKIRDAAASELQSLSGVRQQYEQQRNQPPPQPQVNPQVVNYAKQWMQANPWYDPNGGDRDSALTKAIDNELAKEGYDPASMDYWQELTSRVADALDTGASGEAPKPRKKSGPPVGNTREHAPVSSRKEIYVTPERKQAMQEAGVWEDPVLRQRYLKAYQAYDTGSAR